MPTVVVPSNGPWAASISIPADGEGISSASVLAYMQEAVNRLEYLRQRLPGANPVANLLRLQVPAIEAYRQTGPEWSLQAATPSNPPAQVNAVVSTAPLLYPLDLVPGQVIRSIGVFTRGAAGHAALPAVMPKIELLAVDMATLGGAADPSFVVLAGPVNDASANTAAYQVNHMVSSTGLNQSVNPGFGYYIRYTPESGANSLVGLRAHHAWVEVSG